MNAETGQAMTDKSDEHDEATTPIGKRMMERIPPGRRRGLAIGLALSLGWLALVGAYLGLETGWENLRWMLPHELALVLAGASGPLIALWLIVHYLTRGADLRYAARALQDELHKLTYPDEAAETRVKNLSEALQQQTRQLSEALEKQGRQLAEASEEAAAHMEKMQAAVEQYGVDLKEKTESAATEVGEVRQDLRGHVDELIEIAGEAASRAKSLRGALSEHSAELARTSDKVSRQVSEIGDSLGHDASLLRWLSTRMTERARKVRDSVAPEEPAAPPKAEPVRLHAQVPAGTDSALPEEFLSEEAPPIQSLGVSSK